jgi:hypothetical protein
LDDATLLPGELLIEEQEKQKRRAPVSPPTVSDRSLLFIFICCLIGKEAVEKYASGGITAAADGGRWRAIVDFGDLDRQGDSAGQIRPGEARGTKPVADGLEKDGKEEEEEVVQFNASPAEGRYFRSGASATARWPLDGEPRLR